MDQARLETLARKVREGTATEEEKLEYMRALNAALKGIREILENA